MGQQMKSARSAALVTVLVIGVLVTSMIIIPASGSVLAPAADQVHFTASGDFDTRSETTAVLNQIKTAAPDLHLALGDLSYGTTGQEQSWCDFVHATIDQGFPFELLSGNHESDGINGSINDFSSCMPNQLPGLVGVYGREWYVDVPQVNPITRFIMISPALAFPKVGQFSYAAGSSHYQWTSNAIDGARTKSIPWVVVGMHKPCLSMGSYQCDPGMDLINLLMSKKVDLVLSGHEHLYQRTHQLATGPGCPSLIPNTANPACIADNDSAFTKGAGTVFATVGTGGTPLRSFNPADSRRSISPNSPARTRILVTVHLTLRLLLTNLMPSSQSQAVVHSQIHLKSVPPVRYRTRHHPPIFLPIAPCSHAPSMERAPPTQMAQ